ncbi:MAG: hypothetical protein ACXVHX_02160 [Solirubrobacteraceae bacterium]
MPDLSHRQYAVIALGLLAASTLVVGVYGLLTGPSEPAHKAPGGSATPRAVAQHPTTPASATPPTQQPAQALPHTADPIQYARAVATSLFDWDTDSGLAPADYESPTLADADPSGEETAGLIADVATYLPTTDQWLELATMNVAQHLVIKNASVPATWATAVANAHGELRPGTTAVTIAGTRERTGTWNDQPASTSTPVSFTVFVACPPAFDHCRVLRLSQLDNPLR